MKRTGIINITFLISFVNNFNFKFLISSNKLLVNDFDNLEDYKFKLSYVNVKLIGNLVS